MNAKVAIIGAGINGLATGWFLKQQGFHDFVVLEAAPQAGGKVATWYPDGLVVEKGADSFVLTKPAFNQMLSGLGLEGEIVHPATGGFSIRKGNQMLRPSKGLSGLVATDEQALRESGYFSDEGTKAILNEPNVPPRTEETDESLADFVVRRVGREMLENYAEPLFAGIYSTPAHQLSMQACFPHWLQMEKQHGSLTAAFHNTPHAQKGARIPFAGLKGGMQQLVDALANALAGHIQYNAAVRSLTRADAGYELNTAQGSAHAGQVVVTLQASHCVGLAHTIDSSLAYLLSSFPSTSSSLVAYVFHSGQLRLPLYGSGFVSRQGKGQMLVRSATYTSQKWARRAPEGMAIVRAFTPLSTEYSGNLVEDAWEELAALLQIEGTFAQYIASDWPDALPQFVLGHKERVAAVEEALQQYPGLHFTGVGLTPVGMPDRAEVAKRTAGILAEGTI